MLDVEFDIVESRKLRTLNVRFTFKAIVSSKDAVLIMRPSYHKDIILNLVD